MNRSALIPTAWLLDQLGGDPEWFPHPVRLIGLAISHGESAIRRRGQSERFELISGGALSVAVVAATYCATRQTIRAAHRRSTVLGNSIELLLAWTCLAARNLKQEATSVLIALEEDDLPLARRRLSRIVGRDTELLVSHKICRAVIETLAESASDGILAPLFYMALGGVPLAIAYKAVNTLDSMIGHADERYFFFGKFAARLDDAANFLPSRFTAAAIVAASNLDERLSPRTAMRIWNRDGGKHMSPNAGQPESAIAGALRVQLGGDNSYGGMVIAAPRIGREFPPPSLSQAKSAVRIISAVTLLGVVCGVLLAACTPSRTSKRPSQ